MAKLTLTGPLSLSLDLAHFLGVPRAVAPERLGKKCHHFPQPGPGPACWTGEGRRGCGPAPLLPHITCSLAPPCLRLPPATV